MLTVSSFKYLTTIVHKGGLASNPGNYRPMSLTWVTSVFYKLIEQVITRQVLDYLQHHKLLNDQQHGFLARRSTVTNLLECLSDWNLALDNHQSVTESYIDYSKAFDTVCQSKLLHKLGQFGICSNLLKWIGEFFSNRTQCVHVGSAFSNPKQLTSGVCRAVYLAHYFFCCMLMMLCHCLTMVLYANCMRTISNFIQSFKCLMMQLFYSVVLMHLQRGPINGS